MLSDLQALERAVWARDHAAAGAALFRTLRILAGGKFPAAGAAPMPRGARAERRRLVTRVAAAIATLFADPRFLISDDDFIRYVPFGRTIANCFAASDLASADFVLEALAGDDSAIPAGPARLKYLLLWSLDSAREHPIAELFAIEPALRLPLFVKLLESKPVATAAAHRRREALLENAGGLGLGGIARGDLEGLVGLANAWMLCSYADGARKHQVKAHFNAALRDWLLAAGFRDAPAPARRRLPARPTIAVAAEVMQGAHVQYRYFGQWLRQLRRDFRLCLVTESREIDEANRTLFDEVAGFERRPDGSHLREAARLITGLGPDMVFYPSVGMRHWGVALANLRLAPIQATALGHSASSFCPTIDYYIVEDGYVGDTRLFSETVALLPDSALRFERQPGIARPAPSIRATAPVLRVAVPSNALKLNVVFLRTLATIAKAAPRRMEFHFFPNVAGVEADAVRAAVEAIVPNATVWPVLPYADYLGRLNGCDMTLSPFPFGGLHSVVDSLGQGLPVVAQCGLEPHARTDALMLRLAGMPDWLTTDTEATYVAAALRIVGDDDLRVRLSRQAIACDVGTRLFGDATTAPGTEVAELFAWILRHHERIRASGRKTVRVGAELDVPAIALSA
ncbi:MAG: hypothetical protein JNK67_27420 [Alphaproteobacteria bacterium]|nr:hypothetical protein [Alphaproteobacteria bacterium]